MKNRIIAKLLMFEGEGQNKKTQKNYKNEDKKPKNSLHKK